MSKRKGDPGYAAGWCIHYRSPMVGGKVNKTCEAGVDYDTIRGITFKPCFLDATGQSHPGAQPCAHLRRPTAEEISAHEAWASEHLERTLAVMRGIADWRKAHKGKSAQEVVECPACKGRLHLSISSYNGHVHGRCETDECVSWME
jgi:hypothetical protein